MKREGYLIDLLHSYDNEQSYVVLVVKEEGRKTFYRYPFDPYFYLETEDPEQVQKDLDSFSVLYKDQVVKVKRTEIVERLTPDKTWKKLLKIYCYHPNHVPMVHEALKPYGKSYEYKIPYLHRFLADTKLIPLNYIVFEEEDHGVKEILSQEDRMIPLNVMAFDIEVYNKTNPPDPRSNPIIMISLYSKNLGGKVITYRDSPGGVDGVITVRDEREMIERFCDIVNDEDVDLLIGYNSAMFDIPYLKERSKVLGTSLNLGLDYSGIEYRRHGMSATVRIPGRVHIDFYPVMRTLGGMGAVRIQRYTLEEAYRNIIGDLLGSKNIDKQEIWRYWDDDNLRDVLFRYSIGDSRAVYEISKVVLPVEIQLTKASGLPLSEVYHAPTSKMVESALMRVAVDKRYIIPNLPKESEVRLRMNNPIKGGFVKMPNPGVYEDIIVFDFRGMYPSIVVSHNVDWYSYDPDAPEEECYVSPNGYKFRKDSETLIPYVLKRLLSLRGSLKDKLKTLDKNSREYEHLFAKTQALKILINSFFGYLGYARSRWYCRECASSITAWGRYYITNTIQKAEQRGFQVLYADTDSLFILLKGHDKDDALQFLEEVNRQLPSDMELEFEGYYPRGVFVSKRTDVGKGAKKKYALIDDRGVIKIRGFELVRRDWSEIAKETQLKVLEAILKDGDPKKAVKIVKDVISSLKKGEVPLDKLIIYTELKRDPRNYAVISPEVAAAVKARDRGVKVGKGSIIGYVIGKTGKTVSEKAEYYLFAKDYDPDYYINNQVLPAVMKILRELGYSEEELKTNSRQTTLWE